MKVSLLISILAIAVSCTLDKQEFQKEGYQVFEKYSIAIKAPCDFQIDNTKTIDSTLGNYVVMVCPQIFKDSTRTSFDLQKLMGSGNSVYHLTILQNTTAQQSEFLIDWLFR